MIFVFDVSFFCWSGDNSWWRILSGWHVHIVSQGIETFFGLPWYFNYSLLGRLVPNVLPSDKLLRYIWTSDIYVVMWWIIQSIYRPNDLNLLLIMNDLNLLNCTEIFFHESGYFIVKVSIIQNNLDEKNFLFFRSFSSVSPCSSKR